MTRRRNDGHSTEFGLWLRDQAAISSSAGFIASNLDFIWSNYKTGEWMLIEEKRYMSQMTFPQRKQFERLHNACKSDKQYRGFYLVQFERTCPEDGCIYINSVGVSKESFISFLRFEAWR